MRIGIITGEYPPMEGGVGAFTRELGRQLCASGHEVRVFTRQQVSPDPDSAVAVDAAVAGTWGWSTLDAMARWAAYHRLDILNTQFQTAAFDMHPAIHWLPSHVKSAPVVVTFHDLREPYLFPKAHFVGARQWIVRRLARTADGVISTDRSDERRLRLDWQIDPVEWIPIGSNVRASLPPGFDREVFRREFAIGANDLLISYFGFLNESKGGLVLIDALAHLHEMGIPAHLVMIGGRAGASDATNRAYGQRVDNLIAAHGLESFVHWTGFVDDAAVSASFAASDLTALPYLDGVSLRRGTLMAALVHGQVIVSTEPAYPIPELEGALVTVASGDAAALAREIHDLWKDPPRRQQLQQAALNTARLFRWDAIAARTLDFYQTLLEATR